MVYLLISKSVDEWYVNLVNNSPNDPQQPAEVLHTAKTSFPGREGPIDVVDNTHQSLSTALNLAHPICWRRHLYVSIDYVSFIFHTVI